MSYSKIFKLGTSIFPLGTSVAQVLRGRTIGSAKLARQNGNIQTVGYHNGIEVELRVPICRGPLDTSLLRAREDAVRVILDQGPARLYVHDDRYWACCECRAEPTLISETGFDRFHSIGVTLIGPDDIQFSTATDSETWVPVSGTARAISTGGNSLAYPTISLTVGGSGLQTIAFTVTNVYTWRGDVHTEQFTLAGSVTGGNVIAVKCLPRQSVKIAGVDRMDLFEGIYPRMYDANSLTISWTSSSVTSATLAYQKRYL